MAINKLGAPSRVLIRLLKNDDLGNEIRWGSSFRDKDVKEALRQYSNMDANFEVSVGAVIKVMMEARIIVERDGACVPTCKYGTALKLLEKRLFGVSDPRRSRAYP